MAHDERAALAEMVGAIERFTVALRNLGEVRAEHERVHGRMRSRAVFAQVDRRLKDLDDALLRLRRAVS